MELTRYDAQHDVMTSDHSPIFASFNAELETPLSVPEFWKHLSWHSTSEASTPLTDSKTDRPLQKPGQVQVIFSQLAAVGLEGAKDSAASVRPFVSFHAPFITKDQSTHSRVSSFVSPTWSDRVVLDCIDAVRSASQLLSRSVLLKVRDETVFGVGNDLMASGAISLREVAEKAPDAEDKREATFAIELSRLGLPAGKLRGLVQITWKPSIK